MLTARRLLAQLHKEGFTDVTLTELQVALANIDQSAILQTCQSKYNYTLWDKVSPINGVPASTFLERQDVQAVSEGEILLLYKEGRLVYFQPTDPRQGGFVKITTETAGQVAQEMITPLVQADAFKIIMGQVYTALGI